MIEWQQYSAKAHGNSKYAIVNDRKAEIMEGEHGGIFVKRYKKMLPGSPRGTPWWCATGGPLRLMNHQAAKEYAERWLTERQEG